jgi:hypothetical protein
MQRERDSYETEEECRGRETQMRQKNIAGGRDRQRRQKKTAG